jgi:hypothetical protein
MKHLKKFENNYLNNSVKHTVYYLVFQSDFTKEEQDILREHTDAQQNGYADLIDIGDQDSPHPSIDKILIDKGYMNC